MFGWRKKINPVDVIPVTSGAKFTWGDRKLHLAHTEDWDVQYRRLYGYVVEIKFLPPDEERGAVTPDLLHIVAQLPFRYGETRG